MGPNFKILFLLITSCCVFSAFAEGPKHPDFYKIKKIKIEEVKEATEARGIDPYDFPVSSNKMQATDPSEKVGKVISVGRDLVALGEDVYRLVIKGKPSNVTTYAPISVVPRVNNAPVDILETEGWSIPVKKTYQVVINNLYNVEVVHFRFSVFYSYGGSYNGAGSYLTAVQIVPEYVKTVFGWDFTATMKLGGIINQGSKAAPVAGATLLLEYTIDSSMVAMNNTATYFVNGKGVFQAY